MILRRLALLGIGLAFALALLEVGTRVLYWASHDDIFPAEAMRERLAPFGGPDRVLDQGHQLLRLLVAAEPERDQLDPLARERGRQALFQYVAAVVVDLHRDGAAGDSHANLVRPARLERIDTVEAEAVDRGVVTPHEAEVRVQHLVGHITDPVRAPVETRTAPRKRWALSSTSS